MWGLQKKGGIDQRLLPAETWNEMTPPTSSSLSRACWIIAKPPGEMYETLTSLDDRVSSFPRQTRSCDIRLSNYLRVKSFIKETKQHATIFHKLTKIAGFESESWILSVTLWDVDWQRASTCTSDCCSMSTRRTEGTKTLTYATRHMLS